MYLPRLFRQDDPALLHQVIRQHSFATLITRHDGAPFVSHLPFLLEPGAGEHGMLLGHMARANPQWRDFDPGQEVLTVFQGPHCYVSPSWYEGALHVPTWNYVAVHAYGTPRLMNDQELYRALEALVDTHEAGFERPWRLELPEAFVADLLKAIVGFEIRISRLEGKFKLSQNRLPGDQQRVADALALSENPDARAIAAWMEALVLNHPVADPAGPES